MLSLRKELCFHDRLDVVIATLLWTIADRLPRYVLHRLVFSSFCVSCLPSSELSHPLLEFPKPSIFLMQAKLWGPNKHPKQRLFKSRLRESLHFYTVTKEGEGASSGTWARPHGGAKLFWPLLSYHPRTGRDTHSGSSTPCRICFWHTSGMGKPVESS